ncbi:MULTISPECIES: hypothetical protein [Proteiniphilum]|jgi:competence protein ComGC|uniref:hypothetical protein n=1 Tax=Proteiniphilum TaxID=294702 RepID=UPI001EEBD391|nr:MULTISPECIES: hypothetical protein [Proteiniphilum]ULB34944.1 hypothetical protein KDN43_02500 [Proteiniphilum propionicum]
MGKKRYITHKQLKASTLVELLLTMIISGIIFTLVFDGVDMIKKFSLTVNKRISSVQAMLYSHEVLEYLMENADSVVERNNQFLFYGQGIGSDAVTIGESFFMLQSRGVTDTLFSGYLNYRIIPSLNRINHVDSLLIHCIVNTGDSVWLEYGLPSSRYAYLNVTERYEDPS